MLTVTHGRKCDAGAYPGLHASLLVPVALGAAFTSIGGPIYLAVSVVLNAVVPAAAPGASGGATRRMAEADNYAVEKGGLPLLAATICSCISAPSWSKRRCSPMASGAGEMAFRPEHEICTSAAFGRNLGVGLTLAAFVALVFALTVVKVTQRRSDAGL